MNIKATNIELTDSIKTYVNKKITSLNKFFKNKDTIIYVEVGRTTNHHNKGEIYRAEFDIKIEGEKFYASSEKEDLYTAIDDVREQISKDMRRAKGRKITLTRRGAKSIKKMLKGLSKRNPFTSKY